MKRPRLLFVASREPSYSRVDIVQQALRERFEVISLHSSASSYARRIVSVLWRLICTPSANYDVVFLAFFAQPIFPFVRLLTRKPIISDMYFSIYDTFIQDKQIAAENHPLAKLCLWLDRQTLLRSQLVFTDTAGNAAFIGSLVPPPAPRITRLWISAQPTVFKPLPPLPRTDKASAFRILFYGGFIPLQGVETIVRAAALVQDANVHFDIVGSGQTRARCEALNTELGNENTTFHGWKSQAEVLAIAASSHLVLGVFGASDKALRVIPNKVYEGLAMAKPVLTGDSPAVRELLTPGYDIVACAMAEPERLAGTIRWCLEHDDELLAIGQNGYKTFVEKASPSVVADILDDAVNRAFAVSAHE